MPIPAEDGTFDKIQPMSQFCGTKKMTVAYVDSNAGINSWRPTTKALIAKAAAKCPNITMVYADGQGTLEKTISAIQGFTAQGVGAMVVLTDFGNPTLPAMAAAIRAGIPVTTLNFANPAGTKGVQYTAAVNADDTFTGHSGTEWLISHTKGSCNILHIGGSAGNPLSDATTVGIKVAMAKHPQCKLLNDVPITSDWSPAGEQKGTAGALVQFPKIDGVYNECGTCAPGGWQAFTSANRALVPWVSDDENGLACTFKTLKTTNSNFQHLTVSARNFLGVIALHKAVAAVNKIADSEPDNWVLPVFTDSSDSAKVPKCDSSAPQTVIFSSTQPASIGLTTQEAITAAS